MLEPRRMFDGMSVSFHVTEDCNLRCRYCYEVNKRKRDLPLEYAKRFIELFIDDPDPIGVKDTKWSWIQERGIIIDFIGGDALMRPELCDEIIRYFMFYSHLKDHRWKNRWRVCISTNGTLFGNKAVRDFLYKYRENLSLGVSVDGCPEIHNYNRSNSMNTILEYWDFYINLVGRENASTKATLTNESIPYLYESVRYLHEVLGLHYISMNFVFDKQESKTDFDGLSRQFEKLINYVLLHRDDLYLGLFDKHQRRGYPMNKPDTTWCGSGAMPCLDVDGKIYPCFRFVPQNYRQPDIKPFIVGDIWDGFYKKENFEIIRLQSRGKISCEKCLTCEVETSCAWCIAGAYGETGEFFRQTYICEINKIQSYWAKKYWEVHDGLN
ncbi:MAG: 4Fe-4S cluster-binding domain-containing protein [Spirochaetales bacterium]|nr:4Fe-4S cluster-binding domain-containing protein [Spirochaetales bacterium]